MKRKEPTWILCKEWAVGTDAYNWTLYRRMRKPDGTPGRWNPAGHYPSAEIMLKGLARKISRSEPLDNDLLRHIEATYEAAESRAGRFLDLLRATPFPTYSEARKRAESEQA